MTHSHETLVAYLPRSPWIAAEFLAIEDCLRSTLPEVESAHCAVAQFSVSKKRDVSFGRLRWNEKSFQKWLHDSPGNQAKSSDWEFMSLEASVPDPSAWDMEGGGPDLFVSLVNYKRGLRTNPTDVAILLQVSIGQCAEGGDNTDAARKLDKIRACLDPVVAFRKNVKWAPFTTGGGLRNVLLRDFAKGRRVSPDELSERVLEYGWKAD